MSEQANPAETPKTSVVQMDTTKESIKGYLEDASASLKSLPSHQGSHKLAVFRFIVDTLNITDQATRTAAWKQFAATPSWFGCNASAGNQALGYKTTKEAIVAQFDA